jgi:hypothetical protein
MCDLLKILTDFEVKFGIYDTIDPLYTFQKSFEMLFELFSYPIRSIRVCQNPIKLAVNH